MCGIVGAYSAAGLARFGSSLVESLEIVKYRGPDAEGALVAALGPSPSILRLDRARGLLDHTAPDAFQVFLGHRRLSILDLSSAGSQPMSFPDTSTWIIFNGEIYNYLELRKELSETGYSFRSDTDTEVILAAYDRWNTRCVDKFVGMWAFCILDLKRGTLFLSRDRFGIKPLHYFWDGVHFAFSSEIKQLLCLPFPGRRLNRQAAFEYLHFGSFDHSANTFFTGIKRLPPGHSLVFDLAKNTFFIDRHYRPILVTPAPRSLSDSAEAFRELFIHSVTQHLRSDVEVGSCLSGGLDSSSIVCAIAQILPLTEDQGKQRTFSSHFAEHEANELEYMEEVIQATGVQAHFVYPQPEKLLRDLDRMIWHQEEPFGSTSLFAQWSVFELVKAQGLKVMLDGQGADEQLAGYVGFLATYLHELTVKRHRLRWAYESSQVKRRHSSSWWPGVLARLLPGGGESRAVGCVPWIRSEFQRNHLETSEWIRFQHEEPFGPQELLNNLLYQMTFHHNLPALLRYEDRNSMAFSVEARVPFLDHRLVEFVLGLPSSYKVRHGMTKYVMRRAMRGLLPEKIRNRVTKLGFATPERKWQIQHLKLLIIQAINSSELAEFVSADAARQAFQRIEDLNITDFAPWRWLNLYLWMKKFGVT
jgi:asparagine synthase (glutamine-hydrolysing)